MDEHFTIKSKMQLPQETRQIHPVPEAALRFLEWTIVVEECGYVDGDTEHEGRDLHANEDSVKSRALKVLERYFDLALEREDDTNGNE